jgi:hypothetical protein
MLHFYHILLLSLLFIYATSKDIQNRYSNRTITSSRSIYELAQLRRSAARLAAYYNKTHRKNNANTNLLYTNTPRSKMGDSNDGGNRFLMGRLRTIIFVSSISLIFMIVIVIICIIRKYYQGKNPTLTERIEQTEPFNSQEGTNRKIIYGEKIKDTRKFSRKSRTLPTTM